MVYRVITVHASSDSGINLFIEGVNSNKFCTQIDNGINLAHAPTTTFVVSEQ